MTTNQIGELDMGGPNKFGLGFGIVTEQGSAQELTSVGAFSWGGIYSTNFWVDPKEKIVGLIYKQFWHDPAGESSDKFKVMTYAALND